MRVGINVRSALLERLRLNTAFHVHNGVPHKLTVADSLTDTAMRTFLRGMSCWRQLENTPIR